MVDTIDFSLKKPTQFANELKNYRGFDSFTYSKEDKKSPLADQALSALLKEKGFSVARRTVAKYREQLDIPVARLRKSI